MIKKYFIFLTSLLLLFSLTACKEKSSPGQLAQEANTAYNAGDYGRAAWIFYKLKSKYVDNPNIHISLGYTYLKLGWPLYAGGEFSTAIELTGKTNSLAWIGLGSAYAATNQWKQAILAYLHAAAYDPNNPNLFIKLGNAFYYNNNFEPAAKNYLHAAALGYKNNKLYLTIGKCYEKSAQWSKAVNAFEQALALDKNNSETIHRLMVIYRDKFNNIAKTKAYYNLLKKVNPQLAETEAELFQQKLQQALVTNPNVRVVGKTNIIKKISKEDIRKKQVNAEANRYEKLAQISIMNELPKEALKYYKKAFSTDSTRTYLNKKIAELYEKDFNDFKIAIEFYSKYLDTCKKPGDEFDYTVAKIKTLQDKYNQIEAEERKKRHDAELKKKQEELEKKRIIAEKQKKELEAARKEPQNYNEIILCGVNFLKSNNFDKARNYFQKAITINPDYPNAFHNLGLVYFKQTNYNMAVKYFKTAIEKDSKYADSYLTLGLAYDKLGKKEDAIENFTYYLELAPNTSYADWVNNWLTKNAGAR